MVTAEAVLDRAEELGVNLSVEGDRLRYSPKSQTPAEFVDALRQNKFESYKLVSRTGKTLGTHGSKRGLVGRRRLSVLRVRRGGVANDSNR